MMKLIFVLSLFWALYSTAGALTCMTCTDQTCSSTIPLTCSSETMCITATIRATQSGTSATQLYKACAASSLCPATGTSTFSVNLGSQSTIASAQCCNTDNCNSQTLPAPSSQPTNSLQCIACNPTTSQCTTPITCSGDETNCFSATLKNGANTFPALGCASPNTCTAASGLGSLPFMQSVGSITSGPTCCGTDLCKNPSTTTTAAPTTTTRTTAAAATTSTISLTITSTRAGTLQYLTCTDATCSSTVSVTCSSVTMCITASVLASSSGATQRQIYKGCFLSVSKNTPSDIFSHPGLPKWCSLC
ncbi:phospholipase A2 inhibitor and Ly6/PLAUR domain-containing protein-like [Xiphophorus couchianus]|uniref:phospholipase A2 inhibitor and Ly6/PLAUR domain-containing protein-like n=1 Tax=Xiphophorus couchianus TaxID=32473 RepID=UPI001015E111|nr:phospholipase A2 inhibitor and Ly6/PLAUR domain-containing protein-like [Xiphophorus couchianus]